MMQRMAHRRRDLAEEFKERFGREYDSQEPLLSLSEEEFHFVMGYVSPDSLYRFTYSDPVTDLTYEVLYDFDVDHDKAAVYVLVEEKKLPLTGDVTQRIAQAAFEHWLKGFEDTAETVPASDCAFNC